MPGVHTSRWWAFSTLVSWFANRLDSATIPFTALHSKI